MFCPVGTVTFVVFVLVVRVTGDGEGGDAQIGGSGKQYLQLTENKWDGKTAWFTGSSKKFPLIFVVRVAELFSRSL